MHAQTSNRRRALPLLIGVCLSQSWAGVACNALIDTSRQQCTTSQDCAAAHPYTECSAQHVCVQPDEVPNDGGIAQGARRPEDASGSGEASGSGDASGSGGNRAVPGLSDASTVGAEGTTAARDSGSGSGSGGQETPGNGASGGPDAGGAVGPPQPPSTAQHVLSFDSNTSWDVQAWYGYREPGERPPFDLAFGWEASSNGASGVLTVWAEPDDSDPTPQFVVTAGKELANGPVGMVPVGAPVSCAVFIPATCNLGAAGMWKIFVDGTVEGQPMDWHGEPCRVRGQWATCTVQGTERLVGTKIGFEFWYSTDGDCLYQNILLDSCWF